MNADLHNIAAEEKLPTNVRYWCRRHIKDVDEKHLAMAPEKRTTRRQGDMNDVVAPSAKYITFSSIPKNKISSKSKGGKKDFLESDSKSNDSYTIGVVPFRE